MLDDIKKNYSLVRILIILLTIAIASYVLSLAWIIISKFLDLFFILLAAWLLSFILRPIVEMIQRLLKVSKLFATVLTYILISILLVLIVIGYIPLVTSQILTLTTIIPRYLQSAPPIIVTLNKSLS